MSCFGYGDDYRDNPILLQIKSKITDEEFNALKELIKVKINE